MKKSSNLPPKKRFDNQKQQHTSSFDFRPLCHELLNQVTVMNLCCSRLRAIAAGAFVSGLPEIDRIEATIVDMTSLVEKNRKALTQDASKTRESLDAFVREDTELALKVCKNDDEVDQLTSHSIIKLLYFSVLLFLSACFSVGGDVQAGRNALQTGHANDAVGYLARAAEIDPNYKIPYRVRAGVLSYLGRAYLETGKDKEARQTLEKAVSLDPDDPFAHLYLGVALLRTSDPERGRTEIETGLRAIDATLEYIAQDLVFGYFWDPGMEIRNDIRRTLAAKLDDAQLALAAERIGSLFDEEIDRARRDEARTRGGGGDGGGGGS